MTSVKTTIKNIQMRMNGINEGIEQLKQTTFTDIVRVEYLENFKLDGNEEDNMTVKQAREHYKRVYDDYDKKVNELENEKKELEALFQRVEDTKKQLEEILKIKESMNRAYDVNINNVKIVMNDIVGCVNRYSSVNDKKERLPVQPNYHINPSKHDHIQPIKPIVQPIQPIVPVIPPKSKRGFKRCHNSS